MAENDVFQLSVNQRINGVKSANVYHYQQTVNEGLNEVPAQTLMNAFLENITPLQAAISSDDWTMACFACRRVTDPGGVQFILADNTPGVILEEALAAATALVVSLYAGGSAEGQRGRKYLSGLPIGSHHNGLLQFTKSPAVEAFAAAMLDEISAAVGTAEFKPVLYRAGPPEVIQDLNAIVVQPNFRKLGQRSDSLC